MFSDDVTRVSPGFTWLEDYFSWKNWDQLETFKFVYGEVRLRRPIGPYTIGAQFDFAMIDWETGEISFGFSAEDVYKTRFNLLVDRSKAVFVERV
jgi:hypothetical protein